MTSQQYKELCKKHNVRCKKTATTIIVGSDRKSKFKPKPYCMIVNSKKDCQYPYGVRTFTWMMELEDLEAIQDCINFAIEYRSIIENE